MQKPNPDTYHISFRKLKNKHKGNSSKEINTSIAKDSNLQPVLAIVILTSVFALEIQSIIRPLSETRFVKFQQIKKTATSVPRE